MNEPINYDAAANYDLGLSPEIYRAWLVHQRMVELMARYVGGFEPRSIPPGGGGNQQPASLTR